MANPATPLLQDGRALRRLLIVLGLLAVAAAALWRLGRPEQIPVALRQVERGRVEATVANTRAGTVNACRRSRLAPSTGGQVMRLKVKKGERVAADQVLLEIWNDDLAAQLRLATEQAGTARAHAAEACVLADVAQREAERAVRLKERGFISEERLDRAQSEAAARQAACVGARAAVQEGEARIGVARSNMERTILHAPFAGVVAEITGELGEFTTPSPPGIPTPPAIDLIDDSCLYVTAPIDEVDAPAIRVGMPGRITLDSFRGQRFQGRVRRIAPYVLDRVKEARTADVEVEFGDPQQARALLVGYSADVEIVLQAHDDVLRVPTPALLEGNRVLVYRAADGTLEQRRLRLGLANWEYSEVLEGLAAGERIVLSLEREGVKPGARVVPEAGAAEGAPAR